MPLNRFLKPFDENAIKRCRPKPTCPGGSMQVLLSSIGTRGDVQPIVALGVELQALGHRARLCVPPNFKEWVESYGLECVPIGPDLKKMTGGNVTGKPVLPSKEQYTRARHGRIQSPAGRYRRRKPDAGNARSVAARGVGARPGSGRAYGTAPSACGRRTTHARIQLADPPEWQDRL